MTANHVVFGTGAIGRAIVDELVKRGESVRVVNRSGRAEKIPAGVEVAAADLFNPSQVREVTGGAKVVYQSSQPAYHRWVEEFPALQNSIIEGLTGSGAKLVLVENLYMYGETNGKPMTEDMPYNAHTRKGKVRGELSKAAFAAHRAGKLRVTAGRGSDFFGAWGLTTAAMGERTFYPKMIAAEMGVDPKMSAMGRGMMWFGGLFIPAAKETVEMMYEFEQPFIVDSSRFESAFGMKATPMKEAIRETVTWYRSHPEKK